MAHAVLPVVTEVIEQEGSDPGRRVVRGPLGDRRHLGRPGIHPAAHAQDNKTAGLAEDAQHQTTERVIQSIGIAALQNAIAKLNHHGQNEKRYRQLYEVHRRRNPVYRANIEGRQAAHREL